MTHLLRTAVAVSWLAAAPLSLARAQQPQEQKKIDDFKMITYQAVFLSKGPKWTAGAQADAAAPAPKIYTVEAIRGAKRTEEQRAYVRELLANGKAVVAGHLDGATSPLIAMYILTGTPEDAKQVVAADPGVKAERATAEILKWMGPEGWFQKVTELQP